MGHAQDPFGLSVALATPFTEDRAIDLTRLVAHGRQSPARRALVLHGG
jgi:dihydrodipicolinate synthase/N-acetylneuraminate lyase